MAQNRDPVTEDEIGRLREEMAEQRAEIREALTDDLGGKPRDYDAGKYQNDRASDHFDRVRGELNDDDLRLEEK